MLRRGILQWSISGNHMQTGLSHCERSIETGEAVMGGRIMEQDLGNVWNLEYCLHDSVIRCASEYDLRHQAKQVIANLRLPGSLRVTKELGERSA
jgi:hypothetical protein